MHHNSDRPALKRGRVASLVETFVRIMDERYRKGRAYTSPSEYSQADWRQNV